MYRSYNFIRKLKYKYGLYNVEPKMKWTEQKVRAVVQECRTAATIAAAKKLQELCTAYGKPPTYIHPMYGRCSSMLGSCGGAWVTISAQTGFYRAAKKVAENRHLRFSCSKSYKKGGIFNVYDSHNRQEADIDYAAAAAIKKVLDAHGIKTTGIHSYID